MTSLNCFDLKLKKNPMSMSFKFKFPGLTSIYSAMFAFIKGNSCITSFFNSEFFGYNFN